MTTAIIPTGKQQSPTPSQKPLPTHHFFLLFSLRSVGENFHSSVPAYETLKLDIGISGWEAGRLSPV